MPFTFRESIFMCFLPVFLVKLVGVYSDTVNFGGVFTIRDVRPVIFEGNLYIESHLFFLYICDMFSFFLRRGNLFFSLTAAVFFVLVVWKAIHM